MMMMVTMVTVSMVMMMMMIMKVSSMSRTMTGMTLDLAHRERQEVRQEVNTTTETIHVLINNQILHK